MKTAGKYLENEELEGIEENRRFRYGSDRAGIITMLKDRKYIDVKKTKCMRLIKEKY